MENFWKQLKKPIFALAPMEDVTDTVFREVVLKISSPEYLHILYTEFVSVEGLSHPVGRERVIHRLIVSESERKLLNEKGVKLVAQIWGKNPEKYYNVAKDITENMQFDGIDINMGCPVKKIVKQGSCSALIDQPELAKEIIYAVKEGTSLPVSVKTRTGIKQHDTERWMRDVLETKPDAVILHARTQKMMSDYPAEWDEIRKSVEIRNELAPDIPLIGNGDVISIEDGLEKIKQTGADGAMTGRGIFSDPWFFNRGISEPTPLEKLKVLWFHSKRFAEVWGERRSFLIIRRFFKIYTNSFPGAAELRAKLMETNNIDDVKKVLSDINKQIVE
jgi:nifR3 family TIM-barrel protein